jgi:hypothetical protein
MIVPDHLFSATLEIFSHTDRASGERRHLEFAAALH